MALYGDDVAAFVSCLIGMETDRGWEWGTAGGGVTRGSNYGGQLSVCCISQRQQRVVALLFSSTKGCFASVVRGGGSAGGALLPSRWIYIYTVVSH